MWPGSSPRIRATRWRCSPSTGARGGYEVRGQGIVDLAGPGCRALVEPAGLASTRGREQLAQHERRPGRVIFRPGGARRDWRARFAEKVDRRGPDECWPWLGATNKRSGYGVFGRATGVVVGAHVAAIEYETGEMPPLGMTVDHVRERGCVRRDCVNPSHLDVVSLRENLQRGGNKQKTHCPVGHDYATQGHTRPNGWRYCRTCSTAQQRERRQRGRELVQVNER